MGITGSSLPKENFKDHFSDLLNGTKKYSLKDTSDHIEVVDRAKILLQIDPFLLWDSFLDYPADSFALKPSDIVTLLTLVLNNSTNDDSLIKGNDKIESSVKSYIELISELSEYGAGVTKSNNEAKIFSLDIMAILSSVLLLSNNVTIEENVFQ